MRKAWDDKIEKMCSLGLNRMSEYEGVDTEGDHTHSSKISGTHNTKNLSNRVFSTYFREPWWERFCKSGIIKKNIKRMTLFGWEYWDKKWSRNRVNDESIRHGVSGKRGLQECGELRHLAKIQYLQWYGQVSEFYSIRVSKDEVFLSN